MFASVAPLSFQNVRSLTKQGLDGRSADCPLRSPLAYKKLCAVEGSNCLALFETDVLPRGR